MQAIGAPFELVWPFLCCTPSLVAVAAVLLAAARSELSSPDVAVERDVSAEVLAVTADVLASMMAYILQSAI